MAQRMRIVSGGTTVNFDDIEDLPRRPDFHNRLERRAEDGTLYVSIFGQKLLMETTVIVDEGDKDEFNRIHSSGATATFYDDIPNSGTSSSFTVMIIGNQNPADKWTKVGDWYKATLRIAEI